MKRYLLTKSAKNDLDEIWFYIAIQSGNIATAERVIWRLHEKIVNLAANPGIGRRCVDIDPNGRCSPLDNYIVYYREESRRIVITHVCFTARETRRKRGKQPQAGKVKDVIPVKARTIPPR
jgi:plasmid stabilization system protein ParE